MAGATPAIQTSLISVRVGATEFGVPIGEVEEVLDPPEITRLPLTVPALRGVVSVRGTIVPVLDLGERLFGAPVERAARLVVVRDARTGEPVGLLVDAVIGVVPAGTDCRVTLLDLQAVLTPRGGEA